MQNTTNGRQMITGIKHLTDKEVNKRLDVSANGDWGFVHYKINAIN